MAIHDVAVSSALASVNPLNPHSSLGALGMFLVLFAEARLLAGFFLPGDLRLFSAGLHRTTAAGSSVHLSLTTVLPEAAGGAPLGARTGYLIGAQAGPAVLDRPDRPRLQQAVARADRVLHRYGPGPGPGFVRKLARAPAAAVRTGKLLGPASFVVRHFAGDVEYAADPGSVNRVADSTLGDAVAALDPDMLTPREALDALYRLKALQRDLP